MRSGGRAKEASLTGLEAAEGSKGKHCYHAELPTLLQLAFSTAKAVQGAPREREVPYILNFPSVCAELPRTQQHPTLLGYGTPGFLHAPSALAWAHIFKLVKLEASFPLAPLPIQAQFQIMWSADQVRPHLDPGS